MPDGSITNPASNGSAFPSTITGGYSVGPIIYPAHATPVRELGVASACSIPSGLSVVVTVTKGDNSRYSNAPHVDLVCKTNTTGTWSCPAPPDLVVGQSDYTISVTITYNGTKTDSKTGITT